MFSMSCLREVKVKSYQPVQEQLHEYIDALVVISLTLLSSSSCSLYLAHASEIEHFYVSIMLARSCKMAVLNAGFRF